MNRSQLCLLPTPPFKTWNEDPVPPTHFDVPPTHPLPVLPQRQHAEFIAPGHDERGQETHVGELEQALLGGYPLAVGLLERRVRPGHGGTVDRVEQGRLSDVLVRVIIVVIAGRSLVRRRGRAVVKHRRRRRDCRASYNGRGRRRTGGGGAVAIGGGVPPRRLWCSWCGRRVLLRWCCVRRLDRGDVTAVPHHRRRTAVATGGAHRNVMSTTDVVRRSLPRPPTTTFFLCTHETTATVLWRKINTFNDVPVRVNETRKRN